MNLLAILLLGLSFTGRGADTEITWAIVGPHPAELVAAVHHAIAEWERPVRIRFVELSAGHSPSKSNNLMEFSGRESAGSKQGEVDAYLRIHWEHPPECFVPLAFQSRGHTWMPAHGAPWAGWIHLNPAGDWRWTDLEAVVTHEIGHALGLEHDWRPGSIMGNISRDVVPGAHVSHWDIEAIRRLWPARTRGGMESGAAGRAR